MVDTGNVKQRKNAKAAGPANTSRRASPALQKQEPSDFDDSLMTKLLFASLALVFGAAVWLNPEYVMEQANSYLGKGTKGLFSPTVQIRPSFHPDLEKRDAVVEAFKHAWRAYERDAMGDDEYHPISKKGSNLTIAGGIGYTVVDSLDTMLMMGLHDEYSRARDWVDKKLDFNRDANFNTFETTIRVLGGLLSAYHITNDQLYVDRAVDLADRILPTFDTPAGLPLPQVNLAQRKGIPDGEWPNFVSTAEAATLQLELRDLSQITDNDIYWDKAEGVMRAIKNGKMPHGLASIYLSAETGQFVPSAIRLGSRGDSYYEYLLKQYIQTNRTEDGYRQMYGEAMDGIHNYLIRTSEANKLVYTAELIPEQHPDGQLSWRLTPKQDHLVCFIGGSLMLGATVTESLTDEISVPPNHKKAFTENGQRDWRTGWELIRTCVATHDTATKLAPEIVHFRIPTDGIEDVTNLPDDWYIKGARPGAPAPYDARYILRPETVESLFIAYRLTGDKIFRQYGWLIFQAIEKHCKVPSGGYASIINVDEVPAQQEDKMETFLMSETLKYLFLLFESDEVYPLNQWVFNTEAHPLPIFTPSRKPFK